MSVFDRVVVGVDGTEWGFAALRQALVLAPEASAVRAVTALDTTLAVHTGVYATQVAELLETEAASTREEAQELLADRPGGGALVVRGKPVDVLRRERDALGATLVALGGRRSSRFLGILLGDTGTELLHDGAASTLVARPGDGEWSPRRLVVGLDGSAGSHAALVVADELATRLGGTLEVIAATSGGQAETGAAWADRVTVWEAAPPVGALVERSRAADILVVGSRGTTGVRAIGSVSERVAHQAHCSVLVVHDTPAA